MNREPVVTVASITAAIAAALTLVVSFGLPLTDEQQNAILGIAAVTAPMVAAYFQRKRVTPL